MNEQSTTIGEIEAAIRTIPDFPRPGIQFKDITPVLADPRLFAGSVRLLASSVGGQRIDTVAGIEARGFIFASAVALQLGAGFVPVRKKGKLPYKTLEASYDLEYGTNTIEMHVDAVKPGSRVLLVDDLLATGGTAAAAAGLLAKLGAEVVAISFLVELTFLNGRKRLSGYQVHSFIRY
ncbi:MAG: adenine phosphoribosyltransferase [Verrucomicrobia bacterium]|nr:adenine phosphoribosyltransferase [Verrucomicrobiota bacterium]